MLIAMRGRGYNDPVGKEGKEKKTKEKKITAVDFSYSFQVPNQIVRENIDKTIYLRNAFSRLC